MNNDEEELDKLLGLDKLELLTPKELKKLYGKEWYERNKNKVIAASAKWQKENPEAYRAYREKYYIKNRNKIRKYHAIKRRNNIPLSVLQVSRTRARIKNLPFDLTIEFLNKLYTGRCELTNIEFIVDGYAINPYSPSLDRIIPSKGYIMGNVRFILMGLNQLKGIGTDEDMYRIAKALLENKK